MHCRVTPHPYFLGIQEFELTCQRDRRKWSTITKVECDSNVGVSQMVSVLDLISHRNQPECISNSVVEVDEIFMVNH